MMKKLMDFPSVLLRKIIITAVIGPSCFLFGSIYYLYAHDKVFFFISLIVMFACMIKAATLYSLIHKKHYYELNGVCVRVADKPFSKYRRVRLLDENLYETELMLRKDSKIYIGCRYRFYLINSPELKEEYLMTALGNDNLLGYENLGEG